MLFITPQNTKLLIHTTQYNNQTIFVTASAHANLTDCVKLRAYGRKRGSMLVDTLYGKKLTNYILSIYREMHTKLWSGNLKR
jgi:hypothetical protein